MSRSKTTHQAGKCDCARCNHPLLRNLPPLPPTHRVARRQSNASRIWAEEQAFRYEGDRR